MSWGSLKFARVKLAVYFERALATHVTTSSKHSFAANAAQKYQEILFIRARGTTAQKAESLFIFLSITFLPTLVRVSFVPFLPARIFVEQTAEPHRLATVAGCAVGTVELRLMLTSFLA